MRTENELLVDVLERLNQAQVDYMLTGSMASNFWGIPRTTHDLNFVLVMQPAQTADLIAAFEHGFFIQPESVRRVFRPPYQFNIIDEQSALKADFWLLRDNAFERTAFGRRASVTLFGMAAWISTPEDVIIHKLYWNQMTPSDRQLGDAAGVYAIQSEHLDSNYLSEWAAKLKVVQELADLASGRIRPKNT